MSSSDSSMEAGNHGITLQLSQLSQKLTNLADDLNEVKQSVRTVMAFDRSIVVLSERSESQARDMKFSWERVDQNSDKILKVDQKADEWINKARGAWWMVMIFGGVFQTLIVGSLYWAFTHIQTNDTELQLTKARVFQLEKDEMDTERKKEQQEAALAQRGRQ